MSERVEVDREYDVTVGNCYKGRCRRCGTEYELWWNGGELDYYLCSCGLEYRLEHTAIDLVVLDAAHRTLNDGEEKEQ